jgi:hypothetical protein
MLISQLVQLLSLLDKRMGGADTRLKDLNTKLQHSAARMVYVTTFRIWDICIKRDNY